MTNQTFYNQVIGVLNDLYPSHKKYELRVSEEEQLKEIKLLKETIVRDERFFFVVDCVNRKLRHIHGMEWLGYHDLHFGLKEYIDIMHPVHFPTALVTAKATLTVASTCSTLGFMRQKYITQMPLKNAKGTYIDTKRSFTPFQISKENMVLEYLAEFTIIRTMTEQIGNLSPEVREFYTRLYEVENIIRKRSTEDFSGEKSYFTTQELRVLRELAYDTDLKMKDVAVSLALELRTVETYIRRAMEKAEVLLQHRFRNGRELALFLKNEGVL